MTSSAKTGSADSANATAPSGWAHAPRPGPRRAGDEARQELRSPSLRRGRSCPRRRGEAEHARPALACGLSREISHRAGGLDDPARAPGQDGEGGDATAVAPAARRSSGVKGTSAAAGKGSQRRPTRRRGPRGAAAPAHPPCREPPRAASRTQSRRRPRATPLPERDQRGARRRRGTAPRGTTPARTPIRARCASVSTLSTRVGRPRTPRCAGRGGVAVGRASPWSGTAPAPTPRWRRNVRAPRRCDGGPGRDAPLGERGVEAGGLQPGLGARRARRPRPSTAPRRGQPVEHQVRRELKQDAVLAAGRIALAAVRDDNAGTSPGGNAASLRAVGKPAPPRPRRPAPATVSISAARAARPDTASHGSGP